MTIIEVGKLLIILQSAPEGNKSYDKDDYDNDDDGDENDDGFDDNDGDCNVFSSS